MLTQAKLKEILDYNPDTGVFTWKRTSGKAFKSAKAGTLVQGYRHITIDRQRYMAHRLAWLYVYGVWPTHQIDHINHSTDCNALPNLREVTHSENARNQRKSVLNSSGITGVVWRPSRRQNGQGTWRAQILTGGIYLHRSFENLEDAAAQRRQWELEHGYHPNHGRNF
jgi:hypothetical protein